MADALAVGLDLHPGLDAPRAGRDEHARPGDLDHAHPAHVDRGQVLEVAQRRGVDARPTGRPRGSSSPAGTATGAPSMLSSTVGDLGGGRRLGDPRRAGRRLGVDAGDVEVRHAPAPMASKWTSPPLIALSIADDAVWPRPQIDASRIARARSSNSASSVVQRARAAARPRAARAAPPGAPCPTRHGTHWPHDSSRKNAAIRRSAPAQVRGLVEHHDDPRAERRAGGARPLERERRVAACRDRRTRPRRRPAGSPGCAGRPGRRPPAR